jgi:hypothetical protein
MTRLSASIITCLVFDCLQSTRVHGKPDRRAINGHWGNLPCILAVSNQRALTSRETTRPCSCPCRKECLPTALIEEGTSTNPTRFTGVEVVRARQG